MLELTFIDEKLATQDFQYTSQIRHEEEQSFSLRNENVKIILYTYSLSHIIVFILRDGFEHTPHFQDPLRLDEGYTRIQQNRIRT